MSKEIMSCVKGIEELKIEEKDLKDLQNSKFIGVYGPNGVGKSSLKNGLMNVKEDINWNCENENKEIFINDSLKLDNFGVFDENLVELVKGNVNNLSFLGSEISNLFELLTQREIVLSEEMKKVLELDFFKSDNQEFNIYFKDLQNLKSILKSTKFLNDILNNLTIKSIFNEKDSIIKDRYSRFVKKFNLFGNGLLETSIYLYENTQLHSFNRTTWNSHKNKIAHALDWFVNGKYDDDIHYQLFNFIGKIEKYLKTLYIIKNNFGYVDKSENLDEKIFDELIELDNNYFEFSNEKDSLGLETNEFLEKFRSNSINKNLFFESWEKILKNVNSVTNLANKILNLYDLGYEINLLPNVLDLEKEKKSNLKLIHKRSNKGIEQEDIFKKVSYGEMNIISFCLFIASFIERNKSNEDCQLIFDDPISSYDLNKINITISVIEKLINSNQNLNKVFILTHEKYFLKQVKNYFDDECKKFSNINNNESNNCFKCNANKKYFFLEKNNNVHYLKNSKLNDDLKNYIDLSKSNIKRSNLIGKRIIGLVIKKIIKSFKNNFSKKEINENVNDFLLKIKALNNKIKFKDLSNELKDKELNINLKKLEEITKNDLYSVRDNFDKEFLDWIDQKNTEIELQEIGENNNDYKLFKAQIYIRILNRMIHGEDNVLNLDLSRKTEIIDILFSNKEDLIKTLLDCQEIYREETKKYK